MRSIGVRELRQNASRGLGGLIEDGLARPASDRFSERLAELDPLPDGPPLSEELERLRADER